MNKRLTRISKYMKFILCHEPQSIGLDLDAAGWGNVEELVTKAVASGKSITTEQVLAVVQQCDPALYELDESKTRIRAI